MSSYLKSASCEWPFIGLRPFEYVDHEYLFGREAELDVLETQVTEKRFVAVVGGSGSGKSSLICAGLRQRLARLAKAWCWIEMRPGDAPIRNLALALAAVTGETGDFLEAWADRFERVLSRSSFGIGEALAGIPALQGSKASVLLLVDQFEELFRLANLRSKGNLDAAEHREETTAFVRLLLTATRSSQLPIHVVLTMRSDFIGDCARFHGLPEAVSRSQCLVPGMTRDQREAVIRNPIQLAGGEIDPDLVQRALNDTNEETEQLPILQHAMMRCWERASRRCGRPHLTIHDYTEVGGVEQALSLHANEILEKISEFESSFRLVTKRVFQALTETDEEGRLVRRPQRFRDLIQYVRSADSTGEVDPAAENATRTVVLRFASPDCSFLRIVPSADTNDNSMVDRDPGFDNESDIDSDSIIDIWHEALIRRWDRLNGEGGENWIREEQEDAARYRDLLRYAEREAIIPAEDLSVLDYWWSERSPNFFWARRYTKHNADNFAKVIELLKRSRARAIAAVEESKRYETRVIGIVADVIRCPKVFNGAADSLAVALNKPQHLPNVREYVELLYSALGELREIRRIKTPEDLEKQVFALSFSPAGNLLAAAVIGNLLFYDTESGELVHSAKIKSGGVVSLRWSPDGKRIYVGTSPVGSVLAPGSIKKLRKYFKDCDGRVLIDIGNDEYPAGAGAWSADGKWIVVAGWQRQASLWDAWKGRFMRVIGEHLAGSDPLDGLVTDITASANGERIAIGVFSGKVYVLNVQSTGKDEPSFKLERTLKAIGVNLAPGSLAFDPQNHDHLLAAYMFSPLMALWKVGRDDPSMFFESDSGAVWRVAFDPKSEFVASTTNDAVRLWTGIDSGRAIPVSLRGHRTSVLSVDISPENQNIASGSTDGTIRLWAKDTPLSPKMVPDATSIPFISNEFSVQGSQISVTGNGGRNYSAMLPEAFGEVSAAAVSANGAGIVVVPRSGRPVLLLNLEDHEITVSIPLLDVESEWTAVAFIENNTRIAAKTEDGKIFAWPFYSDVRALEELARNHLPLLRDENGFDKRLEIPPYILRRYAERFSS